jgi:SAM-dependent methyltransferase
MPPSDALRREDQLGLPEKKYPLKVAFCHDCTLVQITETVPPEELFSKDYVYYSSFSNALLEHARKNVEARIASRKLSARKLSGQSLVVELASNDGYLLQFYKQAGVPVLGIDPAEGQARTANERGIHTLCDFFTVDLARRLRDEGKQADVVHGNNVLAHVADTNGFVSGIATILKPDGVAVLEFPYLRDLVEHCEFDTIYHEHLCYFSVHALVTLFERHGLYLNDVEHHPIHGGSLRVFVGKNRDVQPAVSQFLERERREGMNLLEHYAGFAGRVESVKARLRQIVDDLKAEGKSLAAYGAAAKGTILVNYVGLGRDKIDFVVDRNVHKQGRYMPGVHIPIRPVETLTERMPAYTIVLPWNFKDEILAQQTEYRGKGGKFIIPIPWPEIV